MIRVIVAILAIMVCFAAEPQRQNSTRKGLKAVREAQPCGGQGGAQPDTVAATGSELRFSGYEKTLRSTRETVFVTNLSNREIDRVIFHITYLDSSGRQLHKARKSIYAGVPAGETRRLDFPTWDRQFAFYYVRSPKPRVSAIPYSVKIEADSLVYAPLP